MRARVSPPSARPDLIPEMQTSGSVHTLNKCSLIAKVGLQVFLPERPSRQLRLRGSEPGNGPSDDLEPDPNSGPGTAHGACEASVESYEWNM